MPNLILLTTKHLIESTPEKWYSAILEKAILFTGNESKQYIEENKKIFNDIFCKIVYFENYQNSDLIEKEILSINNQFKINKIIVLAEVDILRAARARERLGINGQTVSSAMMYRNKHEMKYRVENAGLLSPRYCPVSNTIDLLNFIDKVGYL